MEGQDALPSFELPPNTKIRVIPPVVGALARFIIEDKNDPDINCSIYFDAHGTLGYFNGPYWEVYPNRTLDDNSRFDVKDISGLMEEIKASLKAQRKAKKRVVPQLPPGK